MASGDFYLSLGVDAAIGRTFMAEDDTSGGGPGGMVAVISYDCWHGDSLATAALSAGQCKSIVARSRL